MENKRILIIDDEEDVLDYLKLLLEINNYEVVSMQNSREAVELFKTQEFFMVITDIAMPEMDGYEVLMALEEVNSKTEFVTMTGFGYNPNHALVKISNTSKHPILFKPFNKDKVLDVSKKAYLKYNEIDE